MTLFLIILFLSLGTPLVLLPIEHMLPYPYIIEEIVKVLIVLIVVKLGQYVSETTYRHIILTGIFFTISESMLYLSNFFALGTIHLLSYRLVATGLLHVGTMLIIYWFLKRHSPAWIVGLGITILIHYFYNTWASGIGFLIRP